MTACGQRLQRGLHDVDGALEVDAEDLLDVVGGEVFEPAGREDACVGAHDVESAVARNGLGDRAAGVLGVGDVGAHRGDLAARA